MTEAPLLWIILKKLFTFNITILGFSHFQWVSGPMVQWFKTSPLHGEDPEFEPRLDQTLCFFKFTNLGTQKVFKNDIISSAFEKSSFS